jgi:TolB-like protein
MLLPRALALCAALCPLAALAAHASPPSSDSDVARPARTIVAVSDFAGVDHELGRFLAETLATDLAKSDRLRPLECIDVRHTLSILHVEPGAAVSPTRAREALRSLHADRLVVGTFLVRDAHIIINARMLDAATGQVVPGAAANVSASRSDTLGASHRLARIFHRCATGADLTIDDSGGQSTNRVAQPDALELLRRSGAAPRTVRPDSLLLESTLAVLTQRLAARIGITAQPLARLRASGPVSRLRAITALLRLVMNADELAGYRDAPPRDPPADFSDVAGWGVPYVAAAYDRGWLPYNRPLRPRQPATWAFVAELVSRMPFDDAVNPDHPDTRYTGLVIDAGDLHVVRDMSARIVDEDGADVYPDKRHLPDMDWLEENGMAAYTTDPMKPSRAGLHPLVVKAIGLQGPGHDEIVISTADAELVRASNLRFHFLWKWNVDIALAP